MKYITRQANPKEMADLLEWLNNPQNHSLFNEFVKVHYVIEYTMKKYDVEKTKKELIAEIRRDKNILHRRPPRSFLKYAAIALLFLALGYFYKQGMFQGKENELLVPEEQSITLELEDGSIEIIDPKGTKKVRDPKGKLVGRQNGNTIVYTPNTESAELVYNTLKVPYGKRFDIRLADSTLVSLNAGSSLRYPVKFLENGNRQVFLTGEAYFHVTENSERPFIVNAATLNVEVLGTEFSITAYPEDNASDVILVEGSVAMYSGIFNSDARTKLVPGDKGSMDKISSGIIVERVNTNVYTAWRNGELVFRKMPLDNILRKLERHYNITIVNQNADLGKEVFNASFRNEPIEKVLGYLNTLYGIEYRIKDNIVIIN
ncbi:MAG: FecR domain-containing protein [Bacteroidota bacterium]